jgi:hypothetical protein
MIPLLFVSSLFFLLIAGVALKVFWILLLAEIILYGLALLTGAFQVGRKSGWRYALLAPAIFLILHFSYGLGCLWGIVRFIIFKGIGLPKPEQYRSSR